MNCPNCTYLNKKSVGECEICKHELAPEPEVKPYQIPKRSKKGKKVHDEDIEFFLEIWEERSHYSEIAPYQFLGDEFDPCFFSHLLTKKAYPYFRHDKRNIMLMTLEEHRSWEDGKRHNSKWNEAKERCAILIKEYYQTTV